MTSVAELPLAEPRRSITLIETIAIAVLLGLGLHHLTESLAGAYESWRSGMGVYWSSARPLFHSYSTAAWLAGLGFAVTVVVVFAAGRGRRWYARAIVGAIGLQLLVQLVVELAHGNVPPLLDAVGIAGAVVAALWVAMGRVSTARSRLRWLAAPAIVAVAIVTGFPLISITWDDLVQRHPPFAIEMDAAYDLRGAWVIVADPHPEIVAVSGIRYEIDRSDGLRFDADDVGAISRDDGEIILHITNADKARALAKRSLQRMSMIDALYVNGRRVAFPQYNSLLLGGQLALRLNAETDAVWTAVGAP